MRFRCHARAVFVSAFLAAIGGSRLASAADGPAPQQGISEQAWWVGARAGVFVPYGGLYSERNLVTTTFRDVAQGGPSVELDAGARFARSWTGYAFAQLVMLGQGSSSALSASHGAENGASTKAVGLALRWTSDPDGWSPVIEFGLGYRWLVASWQDETSLRLGGFGDARLGVGAKWRIGRLVELSPILSFSAGSFRHGSFADEPVGALGSSYTAIALDVGGHFDLVATSR